MPAGQLKNAAPSGARSAGQSASLENPAHLPTLPIVTRRAKTTGLVRAANRAGRLKGSANHAKIIFCEWSECAIKILGNVVIVTEGRTTVRGIG